MEIKVSVIIPTHNNGERLKRAILSLINQDYKDDFEIVIMDDDSTDNTFDIVKEFAKKFSNIVYKKVNNHSAIKNRVEGATIANGKYVMFLDGDDYVKENFISKMVLKLEENDVDLVNCNFYYVKKNSTKKAFFKKDKLLDKYQAIDALFKDTYFRGYMHTKIYKKDLVNKVKMDDVSNIMYEDLLFNFLYLLNTNKVKTIKDSLLYYDKTNEGSITNNNHQRSIHNLMVRNAIRNKIDTLKDDQLLKMFLKHKLRAKLLLVSDYLLSKFPSKNIKNETKKNTRHDFKLIYNKKDLDISKLNYKELIGKI